MKIGEFGRKYQIDKRTISYWTDLGLLHPEVNPKNGYRDYGQVAEEEIKIVLIATAMDYASLEETVDMIKHTPKACVNTLIIHQLDRTFKRIIEQYQRVYEFAEELKRNC